MDIMDFKKILSGFLPYFATPAMLVFLIYNYATDKATNKTLQFDKVEDKVNTIDHVNNAPNEVDNYKAYLELNSIVKENRKNKDDAIRSRASRDSISKLQAVTIYQMKQRQDTIIKYLKK